MSPAATYDGLMRRALAAATVLALLAPVAAVAAAVGQMGCCAMGDDRVTVAMTCCEPTICASAGPARQPKGIDVSVTTAVLPRLVPVSIVAPADTSQPPQHTASPPPVRIRLALISTLLI